MHAGDALAELGLAERAGHRLDLEALGAKDLVRGLVDVLEQEDADFVAREAGAGGVHGGGGYTFLRAASFSAVGVVAGGDLSAPGGLSYSTQ